MKCPNCGYENESTYKFCERCGFDLSKIESESSNDKACPNCGYENREGAKFCLRCGLNLIDNNPNEKISTDDENPTLPQDENINLTEKPPEKQVKTEVNKSGEDNSVHEVENSIDKQVTQNNTISDQDNLKSSMKKEIENNSFKPVNKPNPVNNSTIYKKETSTSKKIKHPLLSIILAIVFIGAGSWYNGQIKRGFIYFILAAIFFICLGEFSDYFLLLLAIVYFIQILDAGLSASDINKMIEPRFLGEINVPEGW
jgi:TM2 domain-containing membrane protein YozV